jgi:hypothetical protein
MTGCDLLKHLNAAAIEAELAKSEERIRTATLETMQNVNELAFDCFHLNDELRRRRLTEKQAMKKLEEHKQSSLESAVDIFRRSRLSGTCAACGKTFSWFTKIPDSPQDTFSITPSRCYACEWKHFDREKRLNRFFKMNPSAEFYVRRNKGKPPRSRQYETVLDWANKWDAAWDCWGGDGSNTIIPGGLILMGASFTGKSTAAYHLLYRIAENASSHALAVCSDQLNRIPDMAREGTLDEFVQSLKNCEVLLLDDLDKVRMTPRVVCELWALVEFRLRGNESPAPIFITTNVRSKAAFLKMFVGKDGDDNEVALSIYNRLVEHCEFIDFDVQ